MGDPMKVEGNTTPGTQATVDAQGQFGNRSIGSAIKNLLARIEDHLSSVFNSFKSLFTRTAQPASAQPAVIDNPQPAIADNPAAAEQPAQVQTAQAVEGQNSESRVRKFIDSLKNAPDADQVRNILADVCAEEYLNAPSGELADTRRVDELKSALPEVLSECVEKWVSVDSYFDDLRLAGDKLTMLLDFCSRRNTKLGANFAFFLRM